MFRGDILELPSTHELKRSTAEAAFTEPGSVDWSSCIECESDSW
jgi:hypothetical protein